MLEREKIIELYDLYKNALTSKQREYFEYYYFDDMSLSEISENLGVSKANIGKVIKVVEMKLKNLENSLHLKEINDLIMSAKDKKLIDKYLKIIYK